LPWRLSLAWQWLKQTVLFREKYTGIRIIDPYSVVGGLGSEKFADPVHLIQAGYDDLAGHVLDVLAGTVEGDKPGSASFGRSRNAMRLQQWY
jgi:hypothetical protein